MCVKNVENIDREKVDAGINTYRQVLIGPQEAPNFAMRRFIIEPGGSMPEHTNTVEHEQYVLNGRAKIGIGDKVFEVQKNDVVYIPADVPHWYETIGNEPFEFLCMVPNKPDIVKIIT
jgi:quercetin dioxygenase-like cupin family protein